MKEVDFRPNWYCIIRKRKRDRIIRASLLGVLGAELCLSLMSVSSQKAEAQQQLVQLRSTVQSQTKMYQDLSELAVNLEELQSKRALLADVSGGAPVHTLLAELSQLMPETLALTKIRYKQHRRIGHATTDTGKLGTPAVDNTEKADELRMTGLAKTDRDIGLLMSRMAASALFENVTLVYSQPVIRNRVQAREFELTSAVPQFE